MRTGPFDLRDVRNAHLNFIANNRRAIEFEAQRAGKFGEVHVHQHPEFTPRTGNLQRGTEYKIARTKSGAVIKLRNKVKYATPIDSGARAHVIRPRRARALRFVVKGAVVFARKVNHPGNRPYRFLYRATRAAGRTFETSMLWQMAKLARSF